MSNPLSPVLGNRAHHEHLHAGHTSAQILKVQAVVAASLKIAAATAMMAFGGHAVAILGVMLLTVNLGVIAWNGYDLGKNWKSPKKKPIDKGQQLTMMTGSAFLFAAGFTLLKTHFTAHSVMAMMKASSMKVAGILGGTGLFILAALHLFKVLVAVKKLVIDKPSDDKKALLLDIVHNVMAAAGLVMLGLIMIGALSAAAASPFGWIALTLIFVAVSLEIAHAGAARQIERALPLDATQSPAAAAAPA